MNYETAIQYFMECADSKNLSPNTTKFYQFVLGLLVKNLPEDLQVEDTTIQHLRAATSALKQKVSLTTCKV